MPLSLLDAVLTMLILIPRSLYISFVFIATLDAFVERIVAKGFGYADAEGSVWFDVPAFDGRKKAAGAEGEDEWEHVYAKLAPWSKGNSRLLEEGEGE